MLSRIVRRAAAATALSVAGCAWQGRVVGPTDWDVVLRVPSRRIFALAVSADGALFASVAGQLLRSRVDKPDQWEVVSATPEVIVDMVAMDSAHVYAVTRNRGRVFEWRPGVWHAIGPELLVRGGWSGDWCAMFHGVDASPSRQIVFPADDGQIPRFDGNAWHVDSIPASGDGNSDARRYARILWSADAVDSGTYAITIGSVLFRDRTRWRDLSPSLHKGEQVCRWNTAITAGPTLYVAGGPPPCLWRRADDQWTNLSYHVQGAPDHLMDAAGSPDGVAVLRSYRPFFVLVQAASVQSFRIPAMSVLAGVVPHEENVYVAGQLGGDAMIVRIRTSLLKKGGVWWTVSEPRAAARTAWFNIRSQLSRILNRPARTDSAASRARERLIARLPVRAQVDGAARYALAPYHGMGSYPDSVRRRVAGDTTTIAYFVNLLTAERDSTAVWDSAAVLWWISESGDRRYLPLLLRFATPEASLGNFVMATYGLARHAERPAVRARLRELIETAPSDYRRNVLGLLMTVNDKDARSLLDARTLNRTPAALRAEVEKRLRGPATPKYRGVWPATPGY